MRTSRGYISKKRHATLAFNLSADGPVYLVVQQLAPACRVAARVRIAGRAGTNRVVLKPRIAHRRLAPGTYRFTVKSRKNGRGKSVVVVVVDGNPSASDLASARTANTCRGGVLGAAASSSSSAIVSARGGSGSTGGGSSAAGSFRPPVHKSSASGSGAGAGSTDGDGGPATPKAQAAPLLNPTEGPHAWIRMLLLAGFALAALLLAAAALPGAAARSSRAGELVAQRRSELALVGGATLLAFALAYVIATMV